MQRSRPAGTTIAVTPILSTDMGTPFLFRGP
jgi:hypothetical protein